MLEPKTRQPGPTVFVTPTDFDLLDRLAHGQRSRAAELLRKELARAIVLADDEVAPPFVRLGSQVEFLDLRSGRSRNLRVVRPEHADIDSGALSIMTEVGAALLGLSAGDSFRFTTEPGHDRSLVVLHVEGP